MLFIFGSSVFALIYGGMLWTTARRWRHLAQFYASTTPDHIEKRHMQSVVLLGLGGYNSLKGIVTIGVHETGVSLRVLPPFALFHVPLFIPYSDINGWQTTWYLDASSTELELRRSAGVKLVVSTELAEWIQSFAGYKMLLRDTAPPRGKAGRGWYAFAVGNAVLGMVMVAWLLAFFLSGQTI